MKTISANKLSVLGWFTFFAGLGALWLTFAYYVSFIRIEPSSPETAANILPQTLYYLFNSIFLLINGSILVLGREKMMRWFSFISILLALSVTASFFVALGSEQWGIMANYFVITVFLGIINGIAMGGPILVPFFLIMIYLGAIKGVRYLSGSVIYVSDTTPI